MVTRCVACRHHKVCKDREEFEYLNRLYSNAMKTYRPDYEKPKLSDIPYINIPNLECKNYDFDSKFYIKKGPKYT